MLTFPIQSDVNIGSSLVCLLEVSACVQQLLSVAVQGVVEVRILWKKFFSEILKNRAVEKEMFNCFIWVSTQSASWLVVFCDAAEMGVQLDMLCSQSKNNHLIFSFEEIDLVFRIWF